MEVRRLTIADAPAWRVIRGRMLREHPEAFGSHIDEFARQTLEEIETRIRENSGPDHAMLGAFEGPELAGTIGIRRGQGVKRAHITKIWGMYVASEQRRKGIGRALLEAALAEIRAIPGLSHVYLGVAKSNREA